MRSGARPGGPRDRPVSHSFPSHLLKSDRAISTRKIIPNLGGTRATGPETKLRKLPIQAPLPNGVSWRLGIVGVSVSPWPAQWRPLPQGKTGRARHLMDPVRPCASVCISAWISAARIIRAIADRGRLPPPAKSCACRNPPSAADLLLEQDSARPCSTASAAASAHHTRGHYCSSVIESFDLDDTVSASRHTGVVARPR